jgi:aldehyde dehydrogenase (NAD+)
MSYNIAEVLNNLKIKDVNPGYSTGTLIQPASSGNHFDSFSPVNGERIASISLASPADYEHVIQTAKAAATYWRTVPAPQRGDVVRELGNALRACKSDLGTLVSYEMGKSLQEGLGEVQEMIDICDFAVGLSRQLYGLTMHSERPEHRMYEQWHPLGIVGIISAFNFPVAVWSWNAALALVCGNVCIWKPSEKTPLCAIACQSILAEVLKKKNLPEGISNLIIGHASGEQMTNDKSMPLISFTGSTRVGKLLLQLSHPVLVAVFWNWAETMPS